MLPATMKNTSTIKWTVIVLAALAFSAALAYFQIENAQGPGQRTATAAPLELRLDPRLVDGNNAAIGPDAYAGKHLLVFFGFTSCPSVCPTEMQRMGQALKKLAPEKAAKLVPVLVTVDPERDTAQVMKDYVSLFGDNIVGLRGDRATTDDMLKSWKVYAARTETGDGDYTMDHSAFIYFVAPDRSLIQVFRPDDKVEQMAATLNSAL